MMHRVKKEHDVNKDKWIGIGGHFENGESPVECLKREVREETGLKLASYRPRGIVTFLYGKDVVEYMHLYTGEIDVPEQKENFGTEDKNAEGLNEEEAELPKLPDCDEGELVWVKKDEVTNLPIWEGDKIFFRLLREEAPFFSLKLVYDEEGNLISSVIA